MIRLQLFFPNFSPVAGTLASFATFGVEFFARPLGGAVFGHFGDRVGRKSMLVITLLMMGGATFCMGLLPTFEQVRVLAPILLVVLRFVQGFAVGGEWGGATLMAVEHAPEESRNFSTRAGHRWELPPGSYSRQRSSQRSRRCRTPRSSPGAGGCRSSSASS